MKRAPVPAGMALLVLAAVGLVAQQSPPTRLALELQDNAALPLTADNTNSNTRAQLARVNYMRDEPGGRRFFVNDLNGPLYILDKQTKAFTTYAGSSTTMATACHGDRAQGAVKAGPIISIIAAITR